MLHKVYDIEPMSLAIKAEQDKGVTVAYWGKYPNIYQFAGRLEHNLARLKNTDNAMQWLKEHPDAMVVYTERHKSDIVNKAVLEHPFRNRYQMLVKASDLYQHLSRKK